MCSSTRGPAICPSLVTWPTSSTAVPLDLANRTSSAVHSRNCDTAPGAASTRSECMVWMESTISTCAVRRRRGADDVLHAGLGDQPCGRRFQVPGAAPAVRPASPTPRRWRTAPRPSALSAAAACSISVDLPMPGSPPIKVTEPGTRPPPSTRSSSAGAGGQPRRLRRWPRRPATRTRRLRALGLSSLCGDLPSESPRPGCSTRRRRRIAPAILAKRLPQFWQTNTSFDFAMGFLSVDL